MTEREFQTMLVKGANAEGIRIVKMIDAPGIGKRPFDIFGISPTGIGIACEAKCVEKLQAVFAWSLFSLHQIEWLKYYAEANAISLFAVYVKESHVGLLIRLTPQSFEKEGIRLREHKSVQLKKGTSQDQFFGLKELIEL